MQNEGRNYNMAKGNEETLTYHQMERRYKTALLLLEINCQNDIFGEKKTERGGVCSLLRAKGLTWIPLVGHILVLVPRFDREFVITDSRDTKMAPNLKSTLFPTKAYVSTNKLLGQ